MNNNKILIFGIIIVVAVIAMYYFTKSDSKEIGTTTQTKTGLAGLNLGNLFSGIFGKTGTGDSHTSDIGTAPLQDTGASTPRETQPR